MVPAAAAEPMAVLRQLVLQVIAEVVVLEETEPPALVGAVVEPLMAREGLKMVVTVHLAVVVEEAPALPLGVQEDLEEVTRHLILVMVLAAVAVAVVTQLQMAIQVLLVVAEGCTAVVAEGVALMVLVVALVVPALRE